MPNFRQARALFLLICPFLLRAEANLAIAADPPSFDIVIYAGTSAAVTTAVPAKRWANHW